MHRVFRALFITFMIGTLLGGRCLPCRDLSAKATTRSCCNKSGACNKLPSSKSETPSPCPLQQNTLALQKASSDAATIHLSGAVPAVLPESYAEHQAFLPTFRVSAPLVFQYSPPPLYVLHERLLI